MEGLTLWVQKESIEYIDKPLSSALDHVEWAFGEVDVSTQELSAR
jgi:hypothetical protein